MLQKLFPPIPHMKDPLGNTTHSERMVRQGPACEGGRGISGDKVATARPREQDAGPLALQGAVHGRGGLPAFDCGAVTRGPPRRAGLGAHELCAQRGGVLARPGPCGSLGALAALLGALGSPRPPSPRSWPGRATEPGRRSVQWPRCRFWEKNEAGRQCPRPGPAPAQPGGVWMNGCL